jgi:ribA/ribD-fused uncharacterized protein
MQRHGDVLAYYTQSDFMSHMYWAGFWHRNLYFAHVEKFIMYGKAMAFNDVELADRILQTDSPYQCKELGKQTKGFTQEVWDQWSGKIALVGNREKYRQNPELREMLMETHPLILAEASFNRVWGSGFAKEDPRNGTPALWPGRNQAGNTLMQVRQEAIAGALV